MSSMRRTWRRERERIYGTPHHPSQVIKTEKEEVDEELEEQEEEEQEDDREEEVGEPSNKKHRKKNHGVKRRPK